jgi:hypothetical protein
MVDVVHDLLAREAALDKLGARNISAEEAASRRATSTSRFETHTGTNPTPVG